MCVCWGGGGGGWGGGFDYSYSIMSQEKPLANAIGEKWKVESEGTTHVVK